MSRRALPAIVVVLLALVVACGGGGKAPRASSSTSPASAPPAPAPSQTPSSAGTAAAPRPTSTAGALPHSATTSALLVPREGSYVYAQSGSEKFCTTTCSTQALPPTRTMSLSIVERTADSVTVTFAGQVSNMRYTRDTIRSTRSRGQLTETYVRFKYGSATFENSYRPQPPIEVIRFPITSGASWSGSWQADTYGNYSVSVGPRESVNVGGRTVKAFRVHIVSTFTGDADGKQDLTVWIDPATAATVRTAGTLTAKTFLGSYQTTFDATLRSAPGY